MYQRPPSKASSSSAIRSRRGRAIFIIHPSDLLTDHRPHGDGLIAFEFLSGLASRGWRLHVAATATDIKRPLPPGMRVYELSPAEPGRGVLRRFAGRIQFIYRTRQLMFSLRSTEDFLLVHQMNPVFTGLSLAALGSGLPVVLGTYVARWPDVRRSGSAVLSVLAASVRWAISAVQQAAATRLLLTTPTAANRISLPGRVKSKIVSLQHGIETATFAPVDGWEARQGALSPNILFYAQLEERKGLRDLLLAYERVLDEVPDCRLTIAGDGSLRETVDVWQQTLQRPELVRVLGRVSRESSVDLFSACTVYCLPSHGEPYGMSALEAMSCARALVITDSGGLADLVPREGSLRVPPGDAMSLAKALIMLLTSTESQVSMGLVNRRHVEGHHTWRAVIDDLEAVYAGVDARA
jgi:glycosyltransferase involved in cell wall biosynthesis